MMMMARNTNSYFYKEYFIEGFLLSYYSTKKMEILKGKG